VKLIIRPLSLVPLGESAMAVSRTANPRMLGTRTGCVPGTVNVPVTTSIDQHSKPDSLSERNTWHSRMTTGGVLSPIDRSYGPSVDLSVTLAIPVLLIPGAVDYIYFPQCYLR